MLEEEIELATPDPRGIYFNSALLPEPAYQYVCWLDVMGTASQMLRSLPIAANFIFKLHCAVLEACEEVRAAENDIRLYPMMDGMYVTAARRGPLQSLLNQALCRLAITFLREEKPFHQFLVRGAVAFGPVYHGVMLPDETADVLADYSHIRDSILVGLPMAQAFEAEREAPPFGIAAHSSARGFAPTGDKPFRFIWLDWFRAAKPPIHPQEMLSKLEAYFDWQAKHHNMSGYDPQRIEYHRQLAREYLTAGEASGAGSITRPTSRST